MKLSSRLSLSLCAAALSTVSFAQFFDWEDQAIGVVPSVSQTNSGVTATATGVAGNVSVFTMAAAIWGSRSLTGIGGALRVDFSVLMDNVTLTYGDQATDDDGTFTLDAYNSSDVLVGTNSAFVGTTTGAFSLNVTGTNISYVIAGTDAGSTLAYDNFAVHQAPVPEPASMIALGLGVTALAARRRRKRSF